MDRVASRPGFAAVFVGVVMLACLACSAGLMAGEGGDDEAAVGRALFRRNWVPAPTRTDAADGLGPLFSARSCVGCHVESGPSLVKPDSAGGALIGGVAFRVGDGQGATHPWYGRQIQTQAVAGLQPEGEARLVVTGRGRVERRIRLFGPQLGPGFHIGARLAPSLAGRGLIERIDEAAVRARGGEAEQRRLGLSGRARLVTMADGAVRIGRFGWKAAQADLGEQTADAFAFDLGLSSPLRPLPFGDCTEAQVQCRAMPHGESAAFDGRELSGQMIRMVARYVGGLAVKRAPRDATAEALFASIGCGGCHVPSLPDKDGRPVEAFTDLLLHDMGADLDDHVGEAGVRSAEWRTAPLLDLAPRMGRRRYLHDGRAASVAEAVKWHGGEGARAREAFRRLTQDERRRLIAYLEQH